MPQVSEVKRPRPRLCTGIVRVMATFFKTSRLWVVHYTWKGRARHWYKALPDDVDGPAVLSAELADVQGREARIVEIRPATSQEESDYLHGTLPADMLCPTGRLGQP